VRKNPLHWFVALRVHRGGMAYKKTSPKKRDQVNDSSEGKSRIQ